MLTFLLVIHAIITAILVGVILMQRSEGGGLGMGGSPTGLMSARGAADFLTRATTILATLFVGLSVVSAVIASRGSGSTAIDTSLARPQTPAPAQAPAPAVPLNGDPLAVGVGAPNTGAAPVTPGAPTAAAPVQTSAPAPEARSTHRPATAPATTTPRVAPSTPVERPVVVPTRAAPTPSLTPSAPAPVPAPVGPPAGNAN